MGIRNVLTTCAVLAAVLAAAATAAQAAGTPAPAFPTGLQWLNTDHPLTLKELRGKVVLLDFWTYACINCIHTIPDLERLEKKYPDTLVIIGVHSGKFSAERLTDNIRAAILRYGITHPVVNDKDYAIWNQYGVQAWPTQVLIDPDGDVVYERAGEGVFNAMDGRIEALVKQFGDERKLNRTPLELTPVSGGPPSAMLSFPGKVLADADPGRLFIADSGHERIVIASLSDGALQATIGSGKRGFEDGDAATASFNNPQGMALRGDELYVADTGNNAIRLVDLKKGTVTTVAGTGKQAGAFLNVAGPGQSTDLDSPWGLVIQDGYLYIAMAGSHQVWRMDLSTRVVGPWAGSGAEGRVDGPLGSTQMAQPSGITTDGNNLYVAESESSSVCSISAQPDGKVTTIAGGELFVFGDVDAKGLKARFQHPLGIAYLDGNLYLADTFNNKIKRIHTADGASETFLGTGAAGAKDGPGAEATFNEPGGLSIAAGKLYIADTDSGLIRVADLSTRQVETLKLHVAQGEAN